MSIEFERVSELMTVKDANNEKTLDGTVLWLSCLDIFVRKNGGRSLSIFAYRPMTRELVFVDENDKVVFSVYVDDAVIKVNNKYKIYCSGSILTSAESAVLKPDISYIKLLKTDDTFQVRSLNILFFR